MGRKVWRCAAGGSAVRAGRLQARWRENRRKKVVTVAGRKKTPAGYGNGPVRAGEARDRYGVSFIRTEKGGDAGDMEGEARI